MDKKAFCKFVYTITYESLKSLSVSEETFTLVIDSNLSQTNESILLYIYNKHQAYSSQHSTKRRTKTSSLKCDKHTSRLIP